MSEKIETTLKAGTSLHGFTVTNVDDLKEFKSLGIHCLHDKSGCEVYHVLNNDEDNLFALAFKTLPSGNNGVAHILEHSVLCGSKKFPVKDPFLTLLKSSMYTFLNAITFPDKTIYPASSTVKQDYYNLFRVYADAVFHPLLKEEVFHQEGHRLEFDDSGNLSQVGIVFNEMKGAYSNHDSVVGEWSYRSLFPDSPYRFDSGGEPKEILKLDYHEFVQFHGTLYHPSNCKIFLYGNIPTEEQLEMLNREYLSEFTKKDIGHADIQQPLIQTSKELRVPYSITEGDSKKDKTSITVNWLLFPVDKPFDVLVMEILSDILLGNSGSPLEKALVDSGLGQDVSPVSGIESELYQLTFSAGLRGTNEEKKDDVLACILDCFKGIVKNGLDADNVEGALRKAEFRHREVTGNSNFSLGMMRRALRGWLHGNDPRLSLEFAPLFDRLRKELKENSKFFEEYIQKYFIDNMHRTVLSVYPDDGLEKQQIEEEKAALQQLQASLSTVEKEKIESDSAALKRFQEEPDSPEAIATLPRLSLDDVPRQVETISSEHVTVNGGTVFYHDLNTNGIHYYDLAFDIRSLPLELLPYLPIFADAVTGTGLPGRSYDRVAHEIDMKTGGISTFMEAASKADDPLNLTSHLYMRVKTLDHLSEEGVSLTAELLQQADFGNLGRLKDIFLELRNYIRSSIIPSGHSYAGLRAESRLSKAAWIEEQWKGIDQLQFLLSMDEEKDIPKLSQKLEQIRNFLLKESALQCSVVSPEETRKQALDNAGRLLSVVGGKGQAEARTFPDYSFKSPVSEGWESFTIPASVGYVSASIPASRITETSHAHEMLLGHILRTGFLWEEIRMKGGAYGAFSHTSGLEGVFSFSSYRDPNVMKTYKAFRGGLEKIARQGIDEDTLENAIIATVGKEIRPKSPSAKGITSFKRQILGMTEEMRQKRREALLSVDQSDLKASAERLLGHFTDSSNVVLAGKEGIQKAKEEANGNGSGWVDKVLPV